jgi:hypothetical protein
LRRGLDVQLMIETYLHVRTEDRRLAPRHGKRVSATTSG